mgnify:CR=1 FL=1
MVGRVRKRVEGGSILRGADAGAHSRSTDSRDGWAEEESHVAVGFSAVR